MKELFLISLNEAMLPDAVMQPVNLLVYLTFICAYVYFSKFMPKFDSHCKAEVHLHHPFQCCTCTNDTASYK